MEVLGPAAICLFGLVSEPPWLMVFFGYIWKKVGFLESHPLLKLAGAWKGAKELGVPKIPS